MDWSPTDEWEGGFGWVAAERMQRASHALLAGGRVWVIDPVDVPGVDERVQALGQVGGVLQLLDRHNRDCAAVAARLGAPLIRAWRDGVELPFEVVPLWRNRFWREAALWEPDTRTLVCAEAVGTAPAFLAPGERLGWHPVVRPFPPRVLGRFRPERVLAGHGAGVFEDADAALQDIVAHGRRRVARALVAAVRASV